MARRAPGLPYRGLPGVFHGCSTSVCGRIQHCYINPKGPTCSTSVPRVFHESPPNTRGTSWSVYSWNTRGTSWTQPPVHGRSSQLTLLLVAMPCDWLLLAGDSARALPTNRVAPHVGAPLQAHVFGATEGRFQWEVMLNRSLTPPCRAALPLAALGDKAGISGVKLVVKNGCDLHWFDREARFERNGRCVHVSLRFLMRQHESTRLLHRGDFEAPRLSVRVVRRSPKARTTDVNFSNPLCSRARRFDLDGCRPLADGALPPRHPHPPLARVVGVPRNLTNCSTRLGPSSASCAGSGS